VSAPVPAHRAGIHVQLVPMRRRHLGSVLRIDARVEPRPWNLSLFLGELALPASRHYVVARAGGRVAGYAGLMLSLDEGHVTKIAVDPAWQRRQIGSRLLLNLTRAARDRGARHMTLEVRVSNQPAQLLYRRFGYDVEGVRKGYYTDNNEDAYVMWVHDIDTLDHARRLEAIEAGIAGATHDEAPGLDPLAPGRVPGGRRR
jgi:ribosomal-protein-alanine N-acetyltransferase